MINGKCFVVQVGMIKNFAKIGALVVIFIAVIAFTLSLNGNTNATINNKVQKGTLTLSITDNITNNEKVFYQLHSVGMEGIQTFLGEKEAQQSGVTKIEVEANTSISNLMVTRIRAGNKKRQTIGVNDTSLSIDFRR